jgi:hypothetical protein
MSGSEPRATENTGDVIKQLSQLTSTLAILTKKRATPINNCSLENVNSENTLKISGKVFYSISG